MALLNTDFGYGGTLVQNVYLELLDEIKENIPPSMQTSVLWKNLRKTLLACDKSRLFHCKTRPLNMKHGALNDITDSPKSVSNNNVDESNIIASSLSNIVNMASEAYVSTVQDFSHKTQISQKQSLRSTTGQKRKRQSDVARKCNSSSNQVFGNKMKCLRI